jgi:hypothetical protein
MCLKLSNKYDYSDIACRASIQILPWQVSQLCSDRFQIFRIVSSRCVPIYFQAVSGSCSADVVQAADLANQVRRASDAGEY